MVPQAIEKLQAGALATDAVTAALVELEVFLLSFHVLFKILEFMFLIFKLHEDAELAICHVTSVSHQYYQSNIKDFETERMIFKNYFHW